MLSSTVLVGFGEKFQLSISHMFNKQTIKLGKFNCHFVSSNELWAILPNPGARQECIAHLNSFGPN